MCCRAGGHWMDGLYRVILSQGLRETIRSELILEGYVEL